MYRQLLIFPRSADPAVVETIARDDMAPHLSGCEGFRSMTISVGPLMGPSARDGAGVVVEVTFETLDDSMAAISSPDFESTTAKVEALDPQIYLFEVTDL